MVFRHKLYQLREERDMKPETFASLVSAILYEKRSVLTYVAAYFVKFDLLYQLPVVCDAAPYSG